LGIYISANEFGPLNKMLLFFSRQARAPYTPIQAIKHDSQQKAHLHFFPIS